MGIRDAVSEAEHREVLECLSNAFEELPESIRETLTAYLLHGQTAVEIAADRDLAAGTVRMRIHHLLDLHGRLESSGCLSL